jgi:hypothetical protein
LTAERLLNKFEGTVIRISIEPLQTHRRVVDPATLRVLQWESETDFGTITYPADAGIESGTQGRAASWRFYDYDADIVIRAPLVGAGRPTPTPMPTYTPTP